MNVRRRASGAVALALSIVVVGCGGAPSSPTAPPASATTHPSGSPPAVSPGPRASSDVISGRFEVDGRLTFLECKGSGSPTVILEAGLGGHSAEWADTVSDLMADTRACRYDRAGLGSSQPRSGGGALTADDRADNLHALLDVAGVKGPYVLAGFSYGGMIIRAFTARYPGEVAGLVFIDATHEAAWAPDSWFLEQFPISMDGGHALDIAGTRAELLAAGDLGARPTIVLTAGRINGEYERRWSPIQDQLAALSSDALHMVATESGHDIRADRPELVTESIRTVVSAIRGVALPTCGPRFEAIGAECLDGTMADLLATWDALRDEVVPTGGDLPAGTYGFKEDDVIFEITIDGGGRLELEMRHADGLVELTTAKYAASGDEVTILWPLDWRIPRTSGVNVARWSVDPDGTIHFVQLDAEQTESWIAAPWVPVASGDAE